MQLVKTHRDTLLRPLQIVSGIVERRHTLPILANILIRKDGDNVSFLSTDIEVQITTNAAIGSGAEAASTTVAARKLLDILRALPEGEVTLTLANKRMTVQSGKSRFNLQTLAAEEFPTVAVAEQFNASVSLPQKTLKHLFNMVHFSMAQQDIRYYLNVCCWSLMAIASLRLPPMVTVWRIAKYRPSKNSHAKKSSSRAKRLSNCSAC